MINVILGLQSPSVSPTILLHISIRTYVSVTDVYPHMPIPRPHATRSCVWEPKGNRCERRGGGFGALADSSDFKLLREQRSQKMGDYLPCTPINRRAKFDAASFILGREILNRTNKQTHTKTVNDISLYLNLAYRHIWLIMLIFTPDPVT